MNYSFEFFFAGFVVYILGKLCDRYCENCFDKPCILLH